MLVDSLIHVSPIVVIVAKSSVPPKLTDRHVVHAPVVALDAVISIIDLKLYLSMATPKGGAVSPTEERDNELLERLTNAELLRAKELLTVGKFEEAVSVYDNIIDDGSSWQPGGKCAAALSLGIAYSLDGDYKSLADSEKYFVLAEDLGSSLATYTWQTGITIMGVISMLLEDID